MSKDYRKKRQPARTAAGLAVGCAVRAYKAACAEHGAGSTQALSAYTLIAECVMRVPRSL